ncbi:MAG: ABC transporter ATP-binding protein [Acidimicrobiia bacterium]|nr:ABC transporter ATP-binding protein [Acidimicrobiia bacterium]NNF10575.1 ABC transporter ATP-binding protein [Acidimicrobiia bacterium]NNL70728.1 ABC transporter ATP-binding protein [Acidimicrobiia bacterium]
MSDPVLSVRNLTTHLTTPSGRITACDDVSFDLRSGEVLGLVGESGSGKTMTALSVLGLLPSGVGRVARGEIILDGTDLTKLSRRRLREIRGRDVGVVFQDPSSSLNPVMTVGDQVVEALAAHDADVSNASGMRRAVELLTLVGIPDPGSRVAQYPHEYSGGMRQRAMIAIAIANQPKVLIADEPTTALDVTIQAQVLDVLRAARRETNAGVILITHDLGIVAEMADRVAVMYAGRIVETGTVRDLFRNPSHPYTVGLLASLPLLSDMGARLQPIAGVPPSGTDIPTGCPFHPRCPLWRERIDCVEVKPPLRAVGDGHFSACHFLEEVPAAGLFAREGRT